MKKKRSLKKTISNKRARFDYEIGDTLVAGIALTGAEAKSLRMGHASLRGSFVVAKDSELYLTNMTVNPTQYNKNSLSDEQMTRSRKLLVTKRQLEELTARRRQGESIVPIKMLTSGRTIKVELGIGRGRKRFDKREALKKRDQERAAKQAVS